MKDPNQSVGYYFGCYKFDPPPPAGEIEFHYKIIGKFKTTYIDRIEVPLIRFLFLKWKTSYKYNFKYRDVQPDEEPDLIVYQRDVYETFIDEILCWSGDFYYFFSESVDRQ